jgi:carbon-monoxide dehydrogenase medium subunit
MMIEPISHLKLPKFDLKLPQSLEEALDLLKTYQSECKILAGGTDLLIELRHRLVKPKVLIDVKNIPELQKLEKSENNLVIGAAVPIEEIIKVLQIDSEYRSLYQALSEMCDEILRQRATLGGNISTASPAADSAGPLLVYKALIEARSNSNGKRTIPIQDFFTGVKKNCLKPDELVISIIIPKPPEGTKSSFKKMKRSAEDLALVGVTGLHSLDHVYLAYTAVAPKPIFMEISEFFSSNPRRIDKDIFKRLWEKINLEISPIADVRSSKEYRLHITEILTREILKEVI